MNEPPEEWAARVFEARIRVHHTSFQRVDDELISKVLLEMRLGHHFGRLNLNLFKRYSVSLYRCYVCNAVIDGENGGEASTLPHLLLHRNQVHAVLDPTWGWTKTVVWECTETPTLEAITALDWELVKREGEYMEKFKIIEKART